MFSAMLPSPEAKKERRAKILRILLALFFMPAGVMHFLKPGLYLAIMPPMLPHALKLVYISGMAEIMGGLGIMIPTVRRWAGAGLILLLIAIFPANIYMLVKNLDQHGWTFFAFLLVLRLPLQFVFIAWVKYVM